MGWTKSSSTSWSLSFDGKYYKLTRLEDDGHTIKTYLKTTSWGKAHLTFTYVTDGYDLNDKEKYKELLGAFADVQV